MGGADAMLAGVPEQFRADAAELARNILFMRGKLAETRRELVDEQVTIPYDNGGGQTGVRQNPAFVAYEALLKSYELAIRELRALAAPSGEQPGRSGRLAEMRRDSPVFKAV